MRRNWKAAIGLLFVAPLVAEYLLGNLSIKLFVAMLVLMPMYGGGALLIREISRRTGAGWPGMFLLGAAYTLIEEGFVTRSLFNPDYLGLHAHLLDHAFVPALGIGVWWTLFMFNLHTFWSVSVSIALVEGVVPRDRETPWLGWVGLSVVSLLFILGLAANISFTTGHDHYFASIPQVAVTGVICVLLILAGLRVRKLGLIATGAVPSAWLTGGAALLLGFGVLIIPAAWNWGAVSAMFALDSIFLVALWALSRRYGWTTLHTLSLAVGGALAYGIHAFIETPAAGGPDVVTRIGNAIFLAAALSLIAAGVKRTSSSLENA